MLFVNWRGHVMKCNASEGVLALWYLIIVLSISLCDI